MVNENSPISAISELSKYNVGVVNSSTGDIVVSDMLGKTSTAIKRFDNTRCCYRNYKRAWDAAVGDVGVVKFYIKNPSG